MAGPVVARYKCSSDAYITPHLEPRAGGVVRARLYYIERGAARVDVYCPPAYIRSPHAPRRACRASGIWAIYIYA